MTILFRFRNGVTVVTVPDARFVASSDPLERSPTCGRSPMLHSAFFGALSKGWYLWTDLFADLPYGEPYLAMAAALAVLFALGLVVKKVLD